MSELVERDFKKAIENWENKKSDIGFNKDLVWNSINGKADKKTIFTWTKIASIIIIILLSSGLAYSIISNHKLKKEKIALTGNIHTLGEEIRQLKNQGQIKIETIIKTDTIIKVIKTPGETENNTLNQLKNQNEDLNNELNELKRLIQEQYNINQTLNDSIEFLAGNFNKNTKPQIANSGNISDQILKVYESEDIKSTNSKVNQTNTNNQSKKIKFTIFNKQENTVYKAPTQQGIRF
ncbi:hypothetical protein [Plebeiibacterium sediminum]|uniref:Uncharacterized protein n=1 Tax=Plebeiibacterium sediminum TaxID=2992112 RepID=A0AAE3SGY3_9BACT|nr:hypothetical protein [Plebeiobacterium sediminum]MCW3787773.1 hypothetical protein [Plebeiobacterium sediminum]